MQQLQDDSTEQRRLDFSRQPRAAQSRHHTTFIRVFDTFDASVHALTTNVVWEMEAKRRDLNIQDTGSIGEKRLALTAQLNKGV